MSPCFSYYSLLESSSPSAIKHRLAFSSSLDEELHYKTPHTKVLNPSRNTLPLANHTKSIDLENLKNTQHSLAIQQQKYKRLRKDYTLSKNNLKRNTIAILFHSLLKIQSLMWILKTWDQICQTEFLKTFSYFWKQKQIIYIFQRLVKTFNEGAYLDRNHLK